MRAWLVLALLPGCGRIAFEPLATNDAGGPLPDGRPTFPAFATANPIPALASVGADDDPAVASDGLELIFSSDRLGTDDLYVTQRASRSDPWPAATAMPEFMSAGVEKGPELSDDGLTLWLYFEGDLAISTRAARGSPWSAPQVVLSKTGPELGTPSVCDGELQMFLREKVTTTNKLYVSIRASTTASWPAPVPLGDITSTAAAESGPWVTPDCNRLYFDSDASGSTQLYVVDRDLATGAFGTATLAVDLSLGFVHDLSLTDDERYCVFAKRVNGIQQIWEASR